MRNVTDHYAIVTLFAWQKAERPAAVLYITATEKHYTVQDMVLISGNVDMHD